MSGICTYGSEGTLLTDIPAEDIKKYVINQINVFFPDGSDVRYDDKEFAVAFDEALGRLEYCFNRIAIRGYYVFDECRRRHPFFQHTHSDQYAVFLYYLANSLWVRYPEKSAVCDKLILLNKMLHGFWTTYKVKLPDIFILVHPLGSILGPAIYSNYLVVCQGVTVGERRFSKNPIGEYCFFGGGSSVIGHEPVGNRCAIGINCTVLRTPVPDNSICFVDRNTGKTVIQPNKKERCRADVYFDVDSIHA